MCSLLFRVAVYCSQQICSFHGKGGKGPPHFTPQSEWGKIQSHWPLAPQQATGQKGKEKVTTEAAAINTSFPTKELLLLALPPLPLPPLPQIHCLKINSYHENSVLWLSVK